MAIIILVILHNFDVQNYQICQGGGFMIFRNCIAGIVRQLPNLGIQIRGCPGQMQMEVSKPLNQLRIRRYQSRRSAMGFESPAFVHIRG